MRNPIAPYQGRHSRSGTGVRVRPYVPLPFTPAPPAYPVQPKASLVRPYVLHHERQRQQWRDDRSRLGLAILIDIARSVEVAA
ncbi:hypothetical protein F4561_005429 [Lipingzhangella halophila]|uniref:Uncharacterized protein n=1 Tax=Lipingzhangella halophila TaxID=1783352 RepID=A0A7W7RMC0_9ACTN|nr:hypothetical protein [Lipingzhangella halophila]MBB4934609.1 hypothetical protein [Lipingzhangella halophila]